ncbi:ACT domain-containing protein [Heliobacillus mobilis]|uniref:UPF0237 protein GJ688_01250 n=2 Tax=Heliobacterium TaxID=2697 RepID=A0A6I3SDA6_HELMO|nr:MULTISPECIES: ACT domain-containing protein [Heliobacterium]MBC9783297.1 ACT domain-containing protein [Heliobacterium chlorum]MTV47605.1 ACT domain-containing protein [Heliobacterium mobile]
MSEKKENRVIVTVLGQDRVGIIASVATIIADAGANILDISQTIMQGEIFSMIMVIDMAVATISYDQLRATLEQKGNELGVQIMAQHEDVFKFMHRI